MASVMRPTMLRQAFAATPSRAFSTAIPAFRSQATRPLQQSVSARLASPVNARVAAFHASPIRAILPPLPQRLEGTVNDAAKVPPASPSHGSYHWTAERLMSAGLVPLTVAPFVYGSLNPVLDSIFAATILIHSHIGFQSIIIDYVPYNRMPNVRKGLMWLLNLATLVVGIGFYEFETNDVGITEAVKRIWRA